MTDLELIRLVSSLGVKLWVEGEALKFSAPRGALTDELKDQLRARKDALRALLAGGAPSEATPIQRVPRTGSLPLSFAQERTWFLHELAPDDPSYAVPLTMRFEGPLDPAALRRALSEIVRRHEVLRTTYVFDGERPVAVIAEASELPLSTSSLEQVPPAERGAELRRELRAEMRRPFDLASGPVVRARLVTLEERHHVLLLVLHHIATDGWSVGLLTRELSALYEAFAAGRPSPLAEPTLQYVDFAAWQRAWLHGGVLDDQLAYWRGRLADAPRLLDLPTDRPRPAARAGDGAVAHFSVDPETSRALDALCRREGVTLFMVLLAAFDVLLHRWSGQREIVVGSPIAGRTRVEVEGLQGLFVNTLALHVAVDPEETFLALLGQVRGAALGAYAHQDLPFERLVQELDAERDMSRSPLFQVMFVLQAGDAGGDGAATAPRRRGVAVEGGTAKFDLMLAMGAGQGGLGGSIEYATDIFDAPTIERFLAGFTTLLTGIAERPEARVWELPILPEGERRRVVAEWNATAFPHPEDALIHELFERQAARTPDAVAVWFEGHALTYAELDAGANRVAHALRARGVGPEVLVGVCMERSIEMVVALYGVLKAGGAYVPFDPDYPRDRLAFMLEDARPTVILTQRRVAAVLPPSDAALLELDASLSAVSAEPSVAPGRGALGLDHLAYVIYTSGSTGRPKGAMNAHRGVLNRLLWMQRAYGLGADDRVLQKTPFSFDVSVWEFFWPLMFGARLVVARPDGHRDPPYLARLIDEQRVTTLHFVPSMLKAFVDEPEARRCGCVRRVICSGEALPPALADQLFNLGLGAELHNLYGPTEAAVDVTAWACQARARLVPIGRPIDNVAVYVLDQHLGPQPIGVPGELFIGGVQVGRGYLNRPELTAERFVADPFSPGGRLYRTGDVVRWLADGSLEYLGRTDFQVKIRGFRIELGEIEAAIRERDGVREVVVVAREDRPGDKRLVAYVVGERVDVSGIRSALLERLPPYMVPSAILALDAMPLTASGKLDRRALPVPDTSTLVAREHVAPRDPVEELVAGIFAEVLTLPCERVGAHDSFFELGGHSLLATRLMARLRVAAGVELPLRAVFEAPTPAALALRVAGALAGAATLGEGVHTVSIPRAPGGAPRVLSFAEERLWLVDQLAPGDPSYVVPIALRLGGELDVAALTGALREITRRHEVLRTVYPSVDGVPTPVVRPEIDLDLELLSLGHLAEGELEAAAQREIAAEVRRPFDLQRGPVIRARLLQLGVTDQILLVTMHHIVSDAWSMGVFSRELSALYEAFSRGAPSPLPELPVQYGDYAAWQRGWLAGEVLDQQLTYWRSRLEGAPRLLELPTDRPRPLAASHRGGRQPVRVPPDTVDGLRRITRERGATMYMTLLAAFDVLLHRYTGQESFVVGTPIAGRTHPEIEGLIGFFVNTLAIRADVRAEATFTELLADVREACLGAYAHQDMPFERLVQELDPERDLSRSPIFQVVFALQNAPAGSIDLQGLKRRGVAADTGAAKFDLTLVMVETAGGIAGSIEYATDLFDAPSVARMAAHLSMLLGGIAQGPTTALHRLPLLPEDERRLVVDTWNATRTAYPRDATIHALFEAQAARAPDATALVFGGEVVSYGELDRRANHLAHLLRERGVERDALVGLYARRSVELLVAMLAILKAGGAYVPLDPDLPVARLSWIAADARLALCVAAGARPAEGELGGVEVLDLSGDAGESAAGPATSGSAADLAYVMYTSGSTGMPKGVCVVHRGVVRLVKETSYLPFGPDEVFVLLAPIAFDASTLEVWGALLNGGRLVISPPEALAPAQIGEVCRASGVTSLWLTSGLFNAVVEAQVEALSSVRRVLTGGEVLSVPHVRRVFEALPGVEVVNGYGPTENTTFTTCHPITPADLGGAIPIGRPIANTTTYILDAHLSPTPIGVPGELYTGGDGLARGYLRRPELTQERFVPDPFSGEPDARLYRTGDLARWLPDGTIAFLGRRDFQVKLRGFRIELGEIEAAIAQQAGVTECVVLLREDAPGDKRLVAYLVASPPPAFAALRAALGERLPGYMIPSAFVVLPAFPLTPNGKVDRRALPPPDASPGEAEAHERVTPRGPVEEAIAGIFADVLRVPPGRVGAHDGFFELGGHSLLATQAITRVRGAFGVELPLRALFEASTPAELASLVSAALAAGGGGAAPPLVPVPRGPTMPLSFAQERLWIIHQLDPTDPSYAVPLALRFTGALRRDALGAALSEIVRRHEILRTTYAMAGGEPVAVVHATAPSPLRLGSLLEVDPGQREAALQRTMSEEVRRPFDLEAGPVFRATLYEMDAEEHVLLLLMHHIVSDGWTIGVLSRELSALYAASSRGEPAPLPELRVQYADYAAWQRAWLRDEVLESHLGYWKGRLAGAPRVLDLPTDRPRPPAPSHRGALRPFSLGADATAGLRDLARREGATLFMVLLAAFDVLLHRWSGQRDIVLGTPIAGRTRAEVEPLIGFFVNTLVMRAEIRDDDAFTDLLRRVREDAIGAYTHQELPFERLVQEIEPQRDLSRAPVFQVMFVLQTAPMGGPRLGGLAHRGVAVEHTTAKFDLTFTLVERREGLFGTMEFATDLFDAATIDRMLAAFEVLLAAVGARPSAPVAELPILTEAERGLVLAQWNATEFAHPTEHLVHELVAAQAARTPDAVAVTCEGEACTYGELLARVSRLAHALRRRGVGPDTLVGVCMERSVELVVALHGVLAAGGAYVPLDPEYPRDRLAFMLEDARPRVIITQARLASTLPPHDAELILLDPSYASIAGEPATPPPRGELGPEHLAYVIYTSGSTGRPKGAMNEHRGVLNRLLWMQRAYRLGADDRVLQKTPFSFDVSVWEFFWPLMFGARLVVARPEGHRDPAYLASLIEGQVVTTVHFVPSMLQAFVVEPAARRCRTLRRVICSGEALPPALADQLFALGLGAELHNLYGPTEAAIDVSAWACAPGAKVVPIGRPIDNVALYVLDERRAPVPTGVLGELYIGGVQVGRGYLNRPELTADRFVESPFGPGRLYRTGDVCRWLPDGALEYLGRTDFQVKVRGFRIELGEIESALTAHPGVAAAVVVARADGGSDKRLVAYLVAAGDAPGLPALRASLRERLPEHMVPAAFVWLDALPLTASGKVDRKALPAPDVGGASEREHVEPRGPVEEAIAGIFAEVLRAPRVGARDGFFELGGHSLLAAQAMGRVRQTLGVDLPLRALFESPSPAELAARVEAARSETSGAQIPAVTRVPRTGPLEVSFGQERLWVLEQIEPGDPTYVVPLTFRLAGQVHVGALERALQEIVRRHEILRTTYASDAGRAVQIIHEQVTVSLPVDDLRAFPDPERAAATAAAGEAHRPFDLATGPVLRAHLYILRDDAHLLLVSLHHIVADAWSNAIFARELRALHDAFAAGHPSPLPELSVQYADYAAWQRRWFSGELLEGQLGYWRRQLEGLPPVLELATDRPRPPVQSHRGSERGFAVPAALAERLRELSRREGATLFMTLLTGFEALLHRYTGQGDFAVGAPIANRGRAETEGLIGFFLNTLVLRAKVEPDLSFRALLARTREACLGAYAHQDMPFERLVQELSPERDLTRSPLFQVAFTLQAGGDRSVTQAAGSSLRVGVANLDTGTAKFDLSLGMSDGPQGLVGGIEFATDLFDAATIERMAAHFTTLLGAAVADPDRPIAELDLMGAAERRLVVEEWNDTAFAHPDDRLIHQIFEAQVERTPEAVAVWFEGRAVTYAELDAQANRLAHALRRRGVGPEVLVGVFMHRSIEMVASLYAVLKAGGAYVPLDPEYPRDRLGFMLDDARPRVILTQDRLVGALPPHQSEVLALDADLSAVSGEPATRPDAFGLGLDSLAYVIYTSGSTGRPKGAMNAHRGILNRLLWMQRAYGLTADDRVLQKTPYSFDVSVWEFFWPLMFGARLVVARPEGHRDPAYLAELVRSQGVTTVHFVPSMLKIFVDEPAARLCGSLRRVICSGEALPPTLADQLFALGLGVELHNLYGPTEAAVDVTAWACAPGAKVVPIGRPIDNTAMYVLDERRAPQPIGVPGELYIGGVQVGRGYLNRDELTAERFLSDPFRPGGRLYRTGDVARWLADGTLEYRGRTDFQVKIRGFRIELGEIEAALRQHPGVRDVVVVARADGGADKHLCAYLVVGDAPPTVGELRAFLKDHLPDHMVPAAFVTLPALPLTASGKVDRRALPAPAAADRLDLGQAYAAPSNEVEERLAAIWASLLRLPRVGVNDNFFAIGGDSIITIQMVARAAQVGIRFTPRQVFLHPTIATLAAEAGSGPGVVSEQGPVTGDVVPTPVVRWWLDQGFADRHHWNQAMFFEVRERLDAAVLEDVVSALLAHHDALRLRLLAEPASSPRLVLAPPGEPAPLRWVDLSGVAPADRRAAIERAAADAQASLDLSAGPVVRVVAFDLGADAPSRLLIVAHHLAVDGVSWRILLDDLWTAYGQRRRAEPIALPAKTTSLQRWAERLAAHARSDALDGERAHWLAVARAPNASLPTDHRLGDNTEASARHHATSLDAAETDDLLRRVPEVYRTQINDVLLTALALALAGWTGADASLVDLEGHGREELFQDVDLTRTVGWFTTIFPVILELRADAGPGEALKAVKEQLRAVPGRGLGHGLLRYLAGDPETTSALAAAPRAEIVFNYLGQMDRPDHPVEPRGDDGPRAAVGAPPEPRPATPRAMPARESAGPSHSPAAHRAHLLELNASVAGGRFHAQWTYSESLHRRETVEGLARSFMDALRGLIAHCSSAEAGGATPSDFDATTLSQDAIDMLAALDPNAEISSE